MYLREVGSLLPVFLLVRVGLLRFLICLSGQQVNQLSLVFLVLFGHVTVALFGPVFIEGGGVREL